MEHSPNGLESVLAQLQAVAAYPVTPVVRVPIGDVVTIKQVLDLGAQNLLVPMISSRRRGRRGRRGGALPAARHARGRQRPRPIRRDGTASTTTSRTPTDHVSLFVQIETAAGVDAAAEIAAVDGVDGVFVGPSDLSASMGVLGQQTHPDVVAAVLRTFEAVRAAGKPVGVNAFDPAVADAYAPPARRSCWSAPTSRCSPAAPRPSRRGGRGRGCGPRASY